MCELALVNMASHLGKIGVAGKNKGEKMKVFMTVYGLILVGLSLFFFINAGKFAVAGNVSMTIYYLFNCVFCAKYSWNVAGYLEKMMEK